MKIEIKKSIKCVDYDVALKFLEKRVEDVINGKKPELLWILEHKPIFTAGTSYKENEILNKTINLIKTSRGGKITYHGPGQKVVYFVLNLKERGKDIRKLIRYIEKCIIQILKEYEINSFNDNKNIIVERGDAKDFRLIYKILDLYKPKLIFHTAAIPLAKIDNLNANESKIGSVDTTTNILECVNFFQRYQI